MLFSCFFVARAMWNEDKRISKEVFVWMFCVVLLFGDLSLPRCQERRWPIDPTQEEWVMSWWVLCLGRQKTALKQAHCNTTPKQWSIGRLCLPQTSSMDTYDADALFGTLTQTWCSTQSERAKEGSVIWVDRMPFLEQRVNEPPKSCDVRLLPGPRNSSDMLNQLRHEPSISSRKESSIESQHEWSSPRNTTQKTAFIPPCRSLGWEGGNPRPKNKIAGDRDWEVAQFRNDFILYILCLNICY